jgi:hypothetical protein
MMQRLYSNLLTKIKLPDRNENGRYANNIRLERFETQATNGFEDEYSNLRKAAL